MSEHRELCRLLRNVSDTNAPYAIPPIREWCHSAADTIETLVAERDALLEVLGVAYIGLSAGCAQYTAKTSTGLEVAPDGQYPWVRSMQIGRDTVRKALTKS
jgi:hypothetical protein